MKLTVLVDNNTGIDKNLYGEPGLSFLLEDDNKQIIFDCGYSDIFIKNAFKLNIDLRNINNIVLSHAHNDHTAGLFYLKQLYQDSVDFNINFKIPEIVSIKNIFNPIIEDNIGNVSCPFGKIHLKKIFKLNLSDEPVWLTSKLCFLGKIKNSNSLIDESSLAYISDERLVIITGCAHVGLENIIEQAKQITNIKKIKTVIGGFHFLNKTENELKNIIKYLKSQNIKMLYPCHCTDLTAKIILSHDFSIKDVCVGDVFEF